MRTDDFDFDLPERLIAQAPVTPRDLSRLLEIRPDGFHDHKTRDLPTLLRQGDLLVLNNTKVIPTRLRGWRGAARIEVTLETNNRPTNGWRWRGLGGD